MKYLFFILMAFLFIGCRDSSEDDTAKLPPETQTGTNTFGCLVNGILFYPRDGTPSVGSNPVGLSISTGSIGNQDFDEIEIYNFKDGKPVNNMFIHLQSAYSKGIGTYVLKQSNFKHRIDGISDNYFLLRAYDYKAGDWKWYSSYDDSGSVVITRYDKVNYIISGTFSGKVKTQDGKNKLTITDGRFDINLSTLPNTKFP